MAYNIGDRCCGWLGRSAVRAWAWPAITLSVSAAVFLAKQLPSEREYIGSDKCAACHADIAKIHAVSDHARTLRRVEQIPELLKQVPLSFRDPKHEVEYRLERSPEGEPGFDLVASKAGQSEKLRLIWGLGAGRKGITFIGHDGSGKYGESRVSWYQRIRLLDITTGAEFSKPKTAHEALAGWLDAGERQNVSVATSPTKPKRFRTRSGRKMPAFSASDAMAQGVSMFKRSAVEEVLLETTSEIQAS